MTDKKTKKRVRDESKHEHAWLLFSQKVSHHEIARRVGIAERTLTRWIKNGDWHSRRAATNITRDELINKTLKLIDGLLEKSFEDNSTDSSGLADKLSKLAGTIKNLDKQANVVDIIQVFMTFNRWLMNRQAIDATLTDDLIKTINRYQDTFINERLAHQKE